MQAIITVALLLTAIYLIIFPSYTEDEKKWAYGIIGLILGFWLRS